jgi:peptidoglycan/LPS O-acetylase OafA/YrhL
MPDAVVHQPHRAPPRRHLPHLDGLRCLCCAWIVVSHFANPRVPNNRLKGVLERGYIAVDFFIVLSGFTTHYAAASKPLGTAAQISRFHLQRVGRILPLHWACVAVQVVLNHYVNSLNLVGSLLLLTAWNCYASFAAAENALFGAHQCDFWPYNPLHWTLSTLLFSWLLYPLMRPLVRCGGARTPCRAACVALAWLCASQLPHVLLRVYLYVVRGTTYVPTELWKLLYQWPPCRVPDFVFGMAVRFDLT